jgi:predicted acetyltransferase
MEYRVLRPEELEQAARVQAQSFLYGTSEGLRETLQKPDLNHSVTYGAVAEDGMVTACMNVLPFEQYLDGAALKMFGIGGVASLVQYRRGGAVRRLFEAIFRDYREQGYALSYLYPFSHRYYRKFGYEQACRYHWATGPTEGLRGIQAPEGRAEQLTPGMDLKEVMDVYDAFACRHNLMLRRSSDRMKLEVDHDPVDTQSRGFLWRDAQGEAKAFLRVLAKSGQPLFVEQLFYVDEGGLMGALALLGNYAGNIEKVTLRCPPEVRPEWIWPEPNELECTEGPLGMGRILDVAQALAALDTPEAAGRVVIEVLDDFWPDNTGRYALQWEKSGSQVQPDCTDAPDLIVSVQALLPLVMGTESLRTLAALRPDITVLGERETLFALFPKKLTYIEDHF